MIAEAKEIERVVALARDSGTIALDTEFVGEGRYRTLLCLIQAAVPTPDGGQQIALIDPLRDGFAAQPLAGLLADPDIEIVLHAGRQDVMLLRRVLGTEISAVFDTQIAAGFLGPAAQRSYESLLSEMLGVKIAKSASFTRWDTRPLSAEQIAYARGDVEHLLPLARELKRQLAALRRLTWASQECEALASASDARDLHAVFARLPRIASLPASAQAFAMALVRWREHTAAREDRPVQSVLPDAALIQIARRKPASIEKLASLRGVPQGFTRRHGKTVLALFAERQALADAPQLPAVESTQSEHADAPIVALLEALARARATEVGLAYGLISTKSELQAIVARRREGEQAPAVRVLSGWRRELVGAELLALLDGKLRLSIEDGAVRIEHRAVHIEHEAVHIEHGAVHIEHGAVHVER